MEGGVAPSTGSTCFFYATCGLVFKLTPSAGGYTETVIHYFTGVDGGCPLAPLVADRAGALFSTASCGGPYAGGTAFMLIPTQTGYQDVTLHNFNYKIDGYLGDESEGLLLVGGYLVGEIPAGGTGTPDLYGGIYALKLSCNRW